MWPEQARAALPPAQIVYYRPHNPAVHIMALTRIPHKRHNKAMDIYHAGDPVADRPAHLGHVELSTTQIYALRLDRGETQSARGAAHVGVVDERPARMEPRRRTTQLARPALRANAWDTYAQRSAGGTRPIKANSPTLRITQRCS